MKYNVFINEYVNGDVINLENPLALTLLNLPNGNVRVSCLIPDYAGQII